MPNPLQTDICITGMLTCMRTTLQLDDHVVIEAKKVAAETGRTLTSFIEDAMRLALASRQEAARRPPTDWTTVGGRGVRPGVDLTDSAGLLDLMEEGEKRF